MGISLRVLVRSHGGREVTKKAGATEDHDLLRHVQGKKREMMAYGWSILRMQLVQKLQANNISDIGPGFLQP